MDKFWERYIQSRPADSKGAFDAFAAAHRDPRPRTMAQEPRNMYAGGQLVRNTADGSRPGYRGNPAMGSKEFIDKRDAGKDIPKVRKYLRTILRRKDSVTFDNIKDNKRYE